jgi:hypothetical protein
MMKYLALVAVMLTTTALGQDPKQQVREILSDMINRRDQLRRYAVVLFGSDGPVKPTTRRQPFAMIRVVDQAREFDLRAHYRYTARYLEYGAERVTTATTYKWRKFPVTNYYLEVPKTQQNKRHRSFGDPLGHDPFDTWLTVWSMTVSADYHRTIEQHLERQPLQAAKMVNGKLLALFAERKEDAGWITTFDPAIEHMPTRTEIRNKDGETHRAINLTWAKVNGQLLPKSLVYEYGVRHHDGTTAQQAKRFKLYWLFDDQIPEEVFTGPDHLLPLLDHLRLPHSRFDEQRDMWVAADLWTPVSLPIPDEFEEFK